MNTTKSKVWDKESKEELHKFCVNRWDYYKDADGGYYPSRHDEKVITEAAEQFAISYEDAEKLFNEIDKEKADNLVKPMSKSEILKLFESILKNNAETPWGQAELNKQ